MELFLSTLIVFCYFGHGSSTDCSDRWVAFEGSCYLFGHDLIHFTEAEEYCRHHGGYLVHVESHDENAFLRDFLRDLKQADYWIGMTDEIVEGIWKWYGTNVKVEFFDWGPTEPQNAGVNGEDCAVFGSSDYGWGDVDCATGRKALCEVRSGTEVIGR